jgi:hypothetical protein
MGSFLIILADHAISFFFFFWGTPPIIIDRWLIGVFGGD